VHMFDAVRWMLNLGWPNKIYSTGGIFQSTESAATIADTQTAAFEYERLNCVWQHRTWGNPTDPEYPWGYKIYGDKGTLSCSVMKYDFVPYGEGKIVHGDVRYEKEKYPEDVKEKNIELHTAPATRFQLINFLNAIESGSRPVADIEEGHISTSSCIIANLAMQLGRPLSYDSLKKEFKNDADANKLLRRKYRDKWTHPEPGLV
jgi:predicted dehydrogenase